MATQSSAAETGIKAFIKLLGYSTLRPDHFHNAAYQQFKALLSQTLNTIMETNNTPWALQLRAALTSPAVQIQRDSLCYQDLLVLIHLIPEPLLQAFTKTHSCEDLRNKVSAAQFKHAQSETLELPQPVLLNLRSATTAIIPTPLLPPSLSPSAHPLSLPSVSSSPASILRESKTPTLPQEWLVGGVALDSEEARLLFENRKSIKKLPPKATLFFNLYAKNWRAIEGNVDAIGLKNFTTQEVRFIVECLSQHKLLSKCILQHDTGLPRFLQPILKISVTYSSESFFIAALLKECHDKPEQLLKIYYRLHPAVSQQSIWRVISAMAENLHLETLGQMLLFDIQNQCGNAETWVDELNATILHLIAAHPEIILDMSRFPEDDFRLENLFLLLQVKNSGTPSSDLAGAKSAETPIEIAQRCNNLSFLQIFEAQIAAYMRKHPPNATLQSIHSALELALEDLGELDGEKTEAKGAAPHAASKSGKTSFAAESADQSAASPAPKKSKGSKRKREEDEGELQQSLTTTVLGR